MLLPTYLELAKKSKENNSKLPLYKLAILGDCSTQHLASAIRGFAAINSFNLNVFDADYNQIDFLLINTSSELYQFMPDSILLYMCSEKLYDTFRKLSYTERAHFAEDIYSKIYSYWQQIYQNTRSVILQFTFAALSSQVFGSYSLKLDTSFEFQIQKLNYLIAKAAQSLNNLFLLDINYLRSSLSSGVFFDEKLYYMAKLTISLEALPCVAKSVIDIINAIKGRIMKCIILDLDNTIWGGVIGDDGIEGIQIGELGLGHVFTDFQIWLKELKNRGIILAVCSKNNEETAKEPFIKHPEMILKLNDISVFMANWEEKTKNILFIQQILNIGFDSMVFIDDNPFERELVKSTIPEITVPNLPDKPEYYLDYLQKLNLFETTSFSEEDSSRTNQYQEEAKRNELLKEMPSYDEYLDQLGMIAEAAPFSKFYYSRIAQLTQRSNQFNLRTTRYTENEIALIANSNDYITLYFTLRDKFGDHGLISIIILQKCDSDSLFINEWLMSCRVLKRGMEEFIMNKIIEIANNAGYKSIIGEYIKTAKNSMVESIYPEFGFTKLNDNLYQISPEEYKINKTYIKENI